MLRKLRLVVSFILLLNTTPLFAFKVTLINADSDHWFWQTMIDVVKEAAADLNIDLEVIDTQRDHLVYRKMALAVFARSTPPDYLVIGNEKESAAKIIEQSDKARTKLFLFNNGFVSPQNKDRFAKPRGIHAQWIEQLIPDNYQAGYDAGEKLIEVLLLKYPQQEIQLLGVTGSFNTHASLERERGFLAAAAMHARVRIMQMVSAEWNGAIAASKTNFLLNRYPRVVGIWAANDEMAEGAMAGAEKRQRIPGKDIYFVGCGWSKSGVAAILNKRMVASTGGHFLDGAWVLARIFDYQQNIDELAESAPSKFLLMDEENAPRLSDFMDKRKWAQFDFKKWTKVFNPRLKNYEESAKLLLDN